MPSEQELLRRAGGLIALAGALRTIVACLRRVTWLEECLPEQQEMLGTIRALLYEAAAESRTPSAELLRHVGEVEQKLVRISEQVTALLRLAQEGEVT